MKLPLVTGSRRLSSWKVIQHTKYAFSQLYVLKRKKIARTPVIELFADSLVLNASKHHPSPGPSPANKYRRRSYITCIHHCWIYKKSQKCLTKSYLLVVYVYSVFGSFIPCQSTYWYTHYALYRRPLVLLRNVFDSQLNWGHMLKLIQ